MVATQIMLRQGTVKEIIQGSATGHAGADSGRGLTSFGWGLLRTTGLRFLPYLFPVRTFAGLFVELQSGFCTSMSSVGSQECPARIAVIGAGPAGFYAVGYLLKQKRLNVQVDVFDKLPVPYGLVRSGVAPDHQKIKSVTRVYTKTASQPGFRFFGNVEYGRDIGLADLRRHYHQVYFSTGAQVDRRLNIPGEDLGRSYSATDFVAWYNGHPEYRHLEFDLSRPCVAVVGVGNVAVDVCRILCRTIDELRVTDIADYALDALAESKVREVHMLGRRGPAQAAFTHPEAKELGELPGADIHVPSGDAELDPVSAAWMEASGDRLTAKKATIIEEFSKRESEGKPRRLTLRFLVSPEVLHDDGTGNVGGVTLRRNMLVEGSGGRISPKPTEFTEHLPAEVVFRSVGYRGVCLPDLPFNDSWGVVPNDCGRVDLEGGGCGVYVGGWIKRGPTGVIGTNKPDALETVNCMLDDLEAGNCFVPDDPTPEAATRLVDDRVSEVISWQDWERIDEQELSAGSAQGRPRVKFVSTESMLAALGR